MTADLFGALFGLSVVAFIVAKTWRQYAQSKKGAAAFAQTIASQPQEWHCEVELTMPVPRPVVFNYRPQMTWFLILPAIFLLGIVSTTEDFFAVKMGHTAPAQLLSKSHYTTPRRSQRVDHYKGQVQYTDGENQGQLAKIEFTAEDFAHYNEGDTLTVHYLSFYPAKAATPTSPSVKTAPAILGMFLLLLTVVSVIAWFFYRRKQRFYREATPTKARVTSIFRTKSGYYCKVAYEFGGEKFEGNPLNQTSKPLPTDRWITILVDPQKPKHVMIYDANDVVRIDSSLSGT